MKISIYIVCCLTLICLVNCTYRSDAHKGDDDTITVDTILPNNLSPIDSDTNLEADTLQLDDDTISYASKPSAKELEELQNLISNRLEHLGNNPLRQNVWGISVLANSVLVSMAINSPYWQSEFRKNISTSPYIEFDGPSEPTPISELGDAMIEQSEIKLQPDSSSFSINSKFVTFTLTNDSKKNIEFGAKYIVGFKGADNKWYILPHPGIWQDMGIVLMPSGKYEIKAAMNPRLNNNRAGIYRLYKQIRFDGNKDDVWLMTEFQLE